MSQKKSFALRLDAALYEALEKWAQEEFRSVNGQIEWALHQQMKAVGRWKVPVENNDQKREEEKSGSD